MACLIFFQAQEAAAVRNLWATTSHGGCSGILSMVWDPRYRVLGEGLVGPGFASPPQRVFSVTTSVRTGVRLLGISVGALSVKFPHDRGWQRRPIKEDMAVGPIILVPVWSQRVLMYPACAGHPIGSDTRWLPEGSGELSTVATAGESNCVSLSVFRNILCLLLPPLTVQWVPSR
jgi:hypothetical protein